MKRIGTTPWGAVLVTALAGLWVPCAGQSILPQVADGGNWRTAVMLVNTTTTTQTASLNFFQDTSQGATVNWNPPFVETSVTQNLTLAPGATMYLHTPGTAPLLTQGWGQVSAGQGVFSFAIYTYGGIAGRPDQDGTSPGVSAATRILVPFDNTAGFATSMAIVNPSASAETVSVNIQTDNGTITQTSLPSPLPANGQLAFTMAQQLPATAGRRGVAEFYVAAAGSSISIAAFRFNPTIALTSIPVVFTGGNPVIGATPPPNALPGKSFVLDGTMDIAGQTVIIQIQAAQIGSSHTVLFTQLAPQAPVKVSLGFNAILPSVVDNTVTFTGSTVGGLYTNAGNLFPFTTATLALTFADVKVTGSVTGTLTFSVNGSPVTGTINATVTSFQ